MSKITTLLIVVFALVAPIETQAAGVQSTIGPISVEVAGLKDQLEKGLKARLPEQFAFVATVVTMVDNKQLSLELVLSTFHWARKRAKYKEHMFPYFERGLRERAARLGINIP